jgi:hypothetical protein
MIGHPSYTSRIGEELKKTFEKDEAWGLAVFLLHEYYKEISGMGSKWGPYIRTLRMRLLTTDVMKALDGLLFVLSSIYLN